MGGHLNMERVSIFIDGNNFYYGLRRIYGKEKSLKTFNFEKFSEFLADKKEIKNIFYYNAQLDKSRDYNKYKSQKEFFDKLKNIPNFNLILCKLLKRKIKGTEKYYYVLKEDDIHMAGDLIKGAFKNTYDIAILVSGDGDIISIFKSSFN